MKKILSIVLVAAMLFSFTSICVSAEDTALSLSEEILVIIPKTHRLTNDDGSGFDVEITVDDKNLVALDGFSDDYTAEITSIVAQKGGSPKITYDENYEAPEGTSAINPFFEYFAVPEGEDRQAISLYVTYKIDFTDAEVFGDINYEISVSGFSAPPDLGDLGGLLGGATDSLPIPTTVTANGVVAGFPTVVSCERKVASEKMIYTDSEMIELDGTQVYIVTSNGSEGTVTYGPQNAHMFTTLPDKTERIPFGTTEIVTYFYGIHLSTLPVNVSHDWSSGPVSITTDKYSENKPGYHAIVCNGCGEVHSAEQHRVDPDSWVSNDDATFVANGTASTVCLDCGATLTKDVHSSAGFNTSFANYHFLLVIFEYINLILRIINTGIG